MAQTEPVFQATRERSACPDSQNTVRQHDAEPTAGPEKLDASLKANDFQRYARSALQVAQTPSRAIASRPKRQPNGGLVSTTSNDSGRRSG